MTPRNHETRHRTRKGLADSAPLQLSKKLTYLHGAKALRCSATEKPLSRFLCRLIVATLSSRTGAVLSPQANHSGIHAGREQKKRGVYQVARGSLRASKKRSGKHVHAQRCFSPPHLAGSTGQAREGAERPAGMRAQQHLRFFAEPKRRQKKTKHRGLFVVSWVWGHDICTTYARRPPL